MYGHPRAHLAFCRLSAVELAIRYRRAGVVAVFSLFRPV